jgi:hypothetical protein
LTAFKLPFFTFQVKVVAIILVLPFVEIPLASKAVMMSFLVILLGSVKNPPLIKVSIVDAQTLGARASGVFH